LPQPSNSCCAILLHQDSQENLEHRGDALPEKSISPSFAEQKLMTLSVDEFLRRFLLHLLPEGFVRIRNFGFLANRKRATTLPLCFQRLGGAPQTEPEASTAGPSDLWSCPKCGGPMMVVERLTATEIQLRSPPVVTAAA
jgi:hypothetical protein